MFSFVGDAVNIVIDRFVDFILPLDNIDFELWDEEYL